MTDLDKLRTAFEEWASGRGIGVTIERGPDGEYTDHFIWAMWIAYQAATALAEARIADLKREVDAAEKRADDQYFRAAGLQEKLGQIEQIAITRHTYTDPVSHVLLLERAMHKIDEIAKGAKE